MKRPRRRDIIVGFTAIIGVIGLAVMLLMFGELPFIGRPKGYPVVFLLNDAGGLTPGSPVTLNGVKVGVVSATTTPEDPRSGVRLGVRINPKAKVPWDVNVAIRRDLLGETTLALSIGPDAPDSGRGFMQAGDERSASAKGMLEEITSVIDARMGTIEQAARDISELSQTYNRVGERIEVMLAPTGDGPDGDVNVVATLRRLDAAIEGAQAWLGDDQLRADARKIATRGTEVLDELAAAIDRWEITAQAIGDAAKSAGSRVDEAAADFKALAASTSEAMNEVQALVAEVRMGEGTISQLVNNPDLYRSLNDAAIRLERTLLEAQLLLEKYRKEGIPIQF